MDSDTVTVIRRCLAGDEQAFADLFENYKNLVYKTAFLMLGSAEEAEDLLQEVFLEVHRSLPNFQPAKGAFSTWLYRITVNDCLNKRRKKHFSLLPLDQTPITHVHGGSPTHEDQLAAEDEVWRALSKLGEKLRAVVVLRYYWDLSYAEVAQILDIPVGTVKSRLNLALQAMRDELTNASLAPNFGLQPAPQPAPRARGETAG